MRIYGINLNCPNFNGQRQDRKAVTQLKEDNPYDLNLPNQRRINNALDNLSKISGEDNIKFLLDVSGNLKYGTNIDLNKKSYNDWHKKILDATKRSVNISDVNIQKKYMPLIEKLENEPHEISDTEKEILKQRKYILSKINKKQLNEIKNPNTKNFERNLDYFIISSEVPTSQKLYIMKRLSHFISEDYTINGQLKDKKTQALAEIVNDIVINTPESEIPNTKAVNQGNHGICAAISICRKNLAYEDKANFVDMIMSELDNNDYMMIYDINKLGSHTKIPVEKTYIDFKYALQRGYRIIDASAMYWMHIADHAGATNERVGHYSAFDRKNFDTFDDIHISADIEENYYQVLQDYYRSLNQAKKEISAYKKKMITRQYRTNVKSIAQQENIKLISENITHLENIISRIAPELSNSQVRDYANTILSLEVSNSRKADKINDYRKDFIFIPKEDDETKIEKLKSFLEIELGLKADRNVLSDNAGEIVKIIDRNHKLTVGQASNIAQNISEARALYRAAAAYRTQADFELDIPENLYTMMLEFNIPDNETNLVRNLENLIKKANGGKLNPQLRSQLAINFNVPNTNEDVAQTLHEHLETVKTILTDSFDDIYSSCIAIDRKNVLATKISNTINEIQQTNDKNLLKQIALELGFNNADKANIINKLNEFQMVIENQNCTEEQYSDIYNKMGYKSQVTDLKTTLENISRLIFSDDESGVALRTTFNVLNGLNPNASLEESANAYNKIAQNFNDLSQLLSSLHRALHIEDEQGNILNSTDAKSIVLKKLENTNEIPTAKELSVLRERFNKIDNLRISSTSGHISNKDIPKEYTALSPFEKDALQKYKKNINVWYSTVSRNLADTYNNLETPLNELHRQNGIRIGRKYILEGSQGLSSRQEVRIIEHMTDRPYYIDSNLSRAINKIKNNPYSGISNTHVVPNEYSGHAQYIADVAPTLIRNKDGQITTKDALFHDNTWGAMERDNIWTDKDGNLRTDYEGTYGINNKGFITNEKYQTGEFVQDLKEATGEIVPNNIPLKRYKKFNSYGEEVIKYPMFEDIIAPGIDPRVNSAVRNIRENLLYSPYKYLDDLEKLAQNMTKAEIKSAMFIAHNAGLSVFNLYDKIEEIVKGDGIVNKGINSREEYDKLADNSLIKTQFEKAAALLSYDNLPADGKMLYKEFDISDLKKLRISIKKEARKDFDYTFAKDSKFVVFAAESVRQEIYNILEVAEKDNNIKIPKKTMAQAVNSMKKISKEDFDGSQENTIKLMVSNFKTYINEHTEPFGEKEKYIDALGEILQKDLTKKTTITIGDLKTSFNSEHMNNISNWIDEEFSPATDEEFVEIFNKLRNMPKAEFESKYNSTITNKVLGIKDITGYDVLKDFKNENDSVQNIVFNTIYYQQYLKDITEQSKLRAYYDYNKFVRTSRGAIYLGDRTFNDIYSDYYYSLLMLSRMQNREKISKEIFKRYNLFQAYPKVEITDENSVEESMNALKSSIEDYITYIGAYKAQKISFELCENMRDKLDRYNKYNKLLNSKQRSLILKDIQNLKDINKDDESIKDLVEKMDYVLTTKPVTVKFYDNFINELHNRFIIYTHTVDGSTMDEAISRNLKNINIYKRTFVNGVFTQKYRSKGMELLNKWVDLKMKSIADPFDEKKQVVADYAFEKFKDFYLKHRVFMKPEEVLNEFLLLSAKDADPINYLPKNTPEAELKFERENIKESIKNHKANLKGLLYKASLLELQEILMNCAQNSNLNVVGKGLIDSKIKLIDGSYLALNTVDGLRAIISPLLAESNLDTAALFFNQLGLAEQITEMSTSEEIFDSAYKNINRINSILKSVDAQAKTAIEMLKSMNDLDNSADYEKRISEYRDVILRKIKSTNYRKAAQIYSAAIEDALEGIKHQPQSSKYLILQTNMQEALEGIKTIVKADIDNLNEETRTIQNTGQLLLKLELPENSDAENKRKNFFENATKLIEYQQEQTQQYKYIGLYRAD